MGLVLTTYFPQSIILYIIPLALARPMHTQFRKSAFALAFVLARHILSRTTHSQVISYSIRNLQSLCHTCTRSRTCFHGRLAAHCSLLTAHRLAPSLFAFCSSLRYSTFPATFPIPTVFVSYHFFMSTLVSALLCLAVT